jgi:hypothetical protein
LHRDGDEAGVESRLEKTNQESIGQDSGYAQTEGKSH